MDISQRAQMNTIATTVFYTGSDAAYDYFYLDIPLGRNDACKVPRSENSVTNRMAVTRKRASWMVFAPFSMTSLTNVITIQEGTNVLIVVPGLKIQEERKSEQGAIQGHSCCTRHIWRRLRPAALQGNH